MEIIVTFHEFMSVTKGQTYMLVFPFLFVITWFWFFLSARDDNEE